MNQSEIVSAVTPLVEIFEELKIGYYIGGSVASSVYGLPRTTIDVDIIADLKPIHVQPLFDGLKDTYYISPDMVSDAIQGHSSFNVIHLSTMLKIDVFVLKPEIYDQTAFQRAGTPASASQEEMERFVMASAEDIVLHKMYWYRSGGEVADRQWLDILGVLKVQGESLDLSYMRTWADKLQVSDLFIKALEDAEIGIDE